MNKNLVKMVDSKMTEWLNGNSEKANKAWARLLKDVKNK